MTPARWVRIKEVLQEALDHHPSERAAFLDHECAGDAELRDRVDDLLASDEEMGHFLSFTPAAVALEALVSTSAAAPRATVGPYRILREIGRGGMGAVYLGERADGHYDKRVAIKIIAPGLDNDTTARRFRNERQVIAALDHPNIARLLDGGATDDGVLYLVMEYVEGEEIDTWCNRRKRNLTERLNLFRTVCAAVQYAHQHGVIHRDIKPSNILVTADGEPKLLDFGIAKTLNQELLSTGSQTTVGPAPMTPEYASPEQVRGEPVGPASDVYALGVVLNQLLTGHLPYRFSGNDLHQILAVICDQEPTRPSVAVASETEFHCETPTRLRRLLRGDLDNIVLKALRKDPERRYSSAAELSNDIERHLEDLPVVARQESLPYRGRKFLRRNRAAALAVVSTACILLAVFVVWTWLARRAADLSVRSIAVLPLRNLSAGADQEYFADGMTDALIAELARNRSVRVISRTSVMSYKGRQDRLPELAHNLGVETIAEGSVRRQGDGVSIAIRLFDGPKDRLVWSGSYEGDLGDVIALQGQIAGAITAEIDATLTGPDRPAAHRRVDIRAYDAYLKGRRQYQESFTRESLEKAVDWYKKSSLLDPAYAPPYAGLADCYYMASGRYYPPLDAMPKARAAALHAIELDGTLGEAHATLALVRYGYEFDPAEAEKGFRRALQLTPGSAEVHLWNALHLTAMRRGDDALAEMERARQLDPVSPALNAYMGALLYFSHRYDEIIQRMRPIIEAHPQYHEPHWWLAMAYEQKGDWAKAIEEGEKTLSLYGDETEGLASMGHLFAMAGRTADARKMLRRILDLSGKRYVPAYGVAVLYAGLGERDEAFRWLRKVEQDPTEDFAFVHLDPRLSELRSDSRFADVLRLMRLPR